MLGSLRLKPRLIAAFLLMGAAPLAVQGVISLRQASEALEHQATSQLHAVRSIKRAQIERYLEERRGDATMLAEAVKSMDVVNEASLTMAHTTFLDNFTKTYGYYDLFLIDPSGYVFHSAAKEPDYHTNLANGPYAQSNLGKLFRRVRDGRKIGLADFEPYAPSKGEPAAFVAAPVIVRGELAGVVALQLSLDGINSVMQTRDGMGQTGEAYLVGPDKLMRSDSFLDPKHHSVKAAFAEPAKGKVETVASARALAGETGSDIIIDYNGNPVLSAWAPLKLDGLNWAVIAEIDEAEALAPVKAMRWTMAMVAVVGLGAVGLAGWLLARSLAGPIGGMTATMTRLAEGDLEVGIPGLDRADELGDMAKAVSVFKDNAQAVRRMQQEREAAEARAQAEKKAAMAALADGFEASVREVVQGVSTAATQMQANARTMTEVAESTSSRAAGVAAASEQASANVQTVASAAEELSASISEIGHRVEDAARKSRQAVERAERTDAVVRGLADSASRIGEVVSLINDIASQTNLLALNATIEAARAGDAGKGFAVVAGEVKHLATQTSRATDDIAQQIAAIQTSTTEAVAAIQDIGDTIRDLSQVSSAIATAVEEQGAATTEIARNVEQAASGTQEVSNNIAGVTQAAQEAGSVATQVLHASTELSRQADHLNDEVDRFLARVRAS